MLGTTNIDFGIGLERELARTRSYRPLQLSVGADAVSLDTGVSSTLEKKIDLPETWVRGLVEVQAALSLAPVELRLHTSAFADVLARLDAQRERQGPRALVFELEPGQPARVVVQPWRSVRNRIRALQRQRASIHQGVGSAAPEGPARVASTGY